MEGRGNVVGRLESGRVGERGRCWGQDCWGAIYLSVVGVCVWGMWRCLPVDFLSISFRLTGGCKGEVN